MKIGAGSTIDNNKMIQVPQSMVCTNLNTLINRIYLSQMATYWFVITWFDNQSVQKSKVRQAAKDVVKSEVYPQTYSS